MLSGRHTASSVVSVPSRQAPGFTSFNLLAVAKDPELQARMSRGDPDFIADLKVAGVDPATKLGMLIKYASPTEINDHNYIVVSSYNVSCNSARGPIDPTADYVGMVLYAKDGQTEWHLNGVKCKKGYIYYRKAEDILHLSSGYGQVHGKLYQSLFDEDPVNVIGSGFSIRQGKWRFRSGTFNHWLPGNSVNMDPKEQTYVKKAVLDFATNGTKVHRIADRRELFLLGPDTIMLGMAEVANLADLMGRMLIHEGQQHMALPGSGKNSVHFEVQWRRGSKLKSIYMRKPPHYTVHQLMLDIQARTRFPAEQLVLSLYGDRLRWSDRLCSCSSDGEGVKEGDVLVLEMQEVSELRLSSTIRQLGQQLLPASRLPHLLKE